MQSSRLQNLPDPLPQILTSLPVFFLLEFLGRNPGTWETAAGLGHRVGITEAEARQALEGLVAQDILEYVDSTTGDRIYRLTRDGPIRDKVVHMAEQINQTRGEFLEFVREIMRRQVGGPHA